MSKKIGIIIQCRDGSTRYKHKSVRPFYEGMSILEIILRRLKWQPHKIIVATSNNSSKTVKICRKMKVDYYQGSEEDVLARMFEAADRYNFDAIIRICADHPFFDLGLMYTIVAWGEIGDYDYVSFDSAMRRHEGFFCEFVSMYALGVAVAEADLTTDREHVTPYIVRNPNLFKMKILPMPDILNEMSVRLTVDTEQDFETAQEVYEHVGEKHWHHVLDYVFNNKLIQANMLREIALNPKRVQ